MNACHACKAPNDSDAIFCTSCGTRLHNDTPAGVAAHRPKAVSTGQRITMVVGCALALGLGLALIVGLTRYITDTAAKSAVREVEKTLPKISDFVPDIAKVIPKSKKDVAKIVDTAVGTDQSTGELKGDPEKFAPDLRDIEYCRDHHYTKTDCTDLLTDTFQQGAYVVQGELAQITQLPVEEENRIGRTVAKQIAKKFGGAMDKDKEWQRYVQTLGNKLVSHVNRPGIAYHFHVIRNAAINAFAIPGGGIYVYTGLLQKIDNEAQLAAVLAHEIKHVDLRHCIFVFQMIKKLPEAMQNPYLFSAGKMITNPYSARQEADADRRGVDLIYSFGYSPYRIVAFWQSLATPHKETGRSTPEASGLGTILGNVFEEVDNVLRSHPRPTKRVCLLKNHIIDLTEAHPAKRVYVGKWNFKNKETMFEKRV
ncbi:hypothetical protein DSCO28_21970 [Desulfosarcina ovata subsp. sediminis]|uniref:Peptidase M48 domain-containing protein n=1 Tax=Desulfosarcina ovata subsp. sediminis TaxID=885957 RepID=A0A5K7ZL39_9BACT|nr:M48 family metalloprotease [Desulfosarcina ovata]BBO81631.1 hypothetical protein DSCO28_21970 [Desulfosarcina ovata subsp. sediminis]